MDPYVDEFHPNDDWDELDSDEISNSSDMAGGEVDNCSEEADDYVEPVINLPKATDQQVKQNSLRQADKFCDIVLLADGIKFPAHRVILYTASEYFRCLIDHDANTGGGTVELKGVSPDGLEAVLVFIYTGEIDFSFETLPVILQTADYFNMKSFIDLCILHLENELSWENAVSIYRQVSMFPNCDNIVELCLNIIGCNIIEISEKVEEFRELSIDEFRRLIQHDKILIRLKDYPIYGRHFLLQLNNIVKHWARSHYISETETNELLSLVNRWSDQDYFNNAAESEKPKFLVPHLLKSNGSDQYGHHHLYAYGFRVIKIRCNTYSNKETVCNINEWEIHQIKVIKLDNWDNISPIVGLQFCYRHLFDEKQMWINSCPETMTGPQYSSVLVELNPNERIHSFSLRHGWMINCITFYTTEGRQLGPYGSDEGGNPKSVKPKPGRYLHGFSFRFINTQGNISMDRITPVYSFIQKALPIKSYYPTFVCQACK